jgi:hypothetical protein
MIRRQNFHNRPDPDVGGETEFERCNFSQDQPVDSGGGVYVGVRLFPGDDTPRTFTNCNLTNAEPPPGSTCVGCNHNILRRNVVTSQDTITVDGQSTTLDHHSQIVYGVYDPVAGSYDYLPTPRQDDLD